MVVRKPLWLAAGALASLTATAWAQPAATGRSMAAELMARRQYADAARVLVEELKGLSPEQSGEKCLMLGECYYLMGEYGLARPYYQKAGRYAGDQREKTIAEYRLACTAYRLGDTVEAFQKTDTFAKAHPTDRRTGTLLVFRMKVLAARGRSAESEMEALNKVIQANGQYYGSAVKLAADKVFTEYLVKQGREDEARERYAAIVLNFRQAIAQYENEKRPVPKGLEEAHDQAAMELGILAVKKHSNAEAVKWLENVRYVPQLVQKSRLLLAQMAYQQQEFNKAMGYLLRKGVLEAVPPGDLRSDMYLLLGLCEKAKGGGNLAKLEEYLREVSPGTEGYFQAQSVLGDLYRDRGLVDQSLRAFENAAPSKKYEAYALFQIGQLCTKDGNEQVLKVRREDRYKKATDAFSKLATKYPASPHLRDAAKSIDSLLAKGYNVTVPTSDEEKAKRWMDTARSLPGSAEAVRALANLARLYHKSVMDEKTDTYVKAPNYQACVEVCDRLLDANAYKGAGLEPEYWKDVRVEALYYRGASNLASHAPLKVKGMVQPQYLKNPSVDRAVGDLLEARKLADAKRLDLVKSVEIALLEAMFKSDRKDYHEQAEKRFLALVNDYGTDVRFQKFAMDLADWYRQQGRLDEAAAQYKGIADRGGNLSQDDMLKCLFLAGKLYSQSAYEARSKPGPKRFGIEIAAKGIKLPSVLETDGVFRQKVTIPWPPHARELSGAEALGLLSRTAKVPFVWGATGAGEPVASYLSRKKVRFTSLNGTVRELLAQIIDPNVHALAYDIGLTGREPTYKPGPVDANEPGEVVGARTYEIYDARRPFDRYTPLAQPYGAWSSAHGRTAMIYNVAERVEKLTGTKVLWAEGVNKDDVRAAEFKQIPGIAADQSLSVGETLSRLLEPLELRFEVVTRDRAAELYDLAKGCFNEIRKINPKSSYGESSLFLLALNFYRQEDFERMKIVLKEYLKVFDSPSYPYYHEACFWVGWTFENEKRYREACRWYNRAAEERLAVYKPDPNEKLPTPEQRRAALSYETSYALEEPVDGEFRQATLEGQFVEFIRLATNVQLVVDASATGITTPISRPRFTQVQAYDLLCDVLKELALSFRPVNVNKSVAEKALYRLAAAYKKDELMPQALRTCQVLMARYPETGRARDVYKLRLEIYKALKDYRNVLATLREMKARLKGQIEEYKIDYEMAWVFFDLCRYKEAAAIFLGALNGSPDALERVKIRDGLARALFRAGELVEALNHYELLAKEDPEPLKRFVAQQMTWYLRLATKRRVMDTVPPDVKELIDWYEKLSDGQRSKLPAETLAKVTWVYYVRGLLLLEAGKTAEATDYFDAASTSPDDWLAADSLYRLAEIQVKTDKLKDAKVTLENLLFLTKSAEVEVRATYALGKCLEASGDRQGAAARFDQVLARFPDSAQAMLLRPAETQPAATQPAEGGTGK